MRFAKYHGIGNDFIMVADPEDRLELAPDFVRRLCDRRFGIGADGVIRVAPGRDGADLLMDYVNSDGSVGEMCGNGIRCLALFARAEGLARGAELTVGTGAGLKQVVVLDDGRVRVDMGPPIFTPADVPVRHDGPNALDVALTGPPPERERVHAACLSMGNPHAVVFVDDPSAVDVAGIGSHLEHAPQFPNGANVEFVRVISPQKVEMRVWERGSGETLACGTGACAAAVAARLLGGTEPEVVVSLPGGELEIEWAGSLERTAPVFMTGPAVRSFDGEIDLEVVV